MLDSVDSSLLIKGHVNFIEFKTIHRRALLLSLLAILQFITFFAAVTAVFLIHFLIFSVSTVNNDLGDDSESARLRALSRTRIAIFIILFRRCERHVLFG